MKLKKGLVNSCLLSVFALSACLNINHDEGVDQFLSKYGNSDAKSESFSHCQGYGCKFPQRVSLSKDEWRLIKRPMLGKIKSPSGEREKLKLAIAKYESIVGKKTGSENDKGGTFGHIGEVGQLDCVDEAINTSTLLVMLDNEGLIKFHTLRGPTWRGVFLNGWPHTASVIIDDKTGQHYAVDSWEEDNGGSPIIVSIDEWRGRSVFNREKANSIPIPVLKPDIAG